MGPCNGSTYGACYDRIARMSILAFGINHKTASIVLREKLSFQGHRLSEALRELVARKTIREAAILSTCNRTEIYAITDHIEELNEWLAGTHALSSAQLAGITYTHQGMQAVQHMMRVASGLDSMILGEPQILGQMKQAYKAAQISGSLGQQLDQIFQAVFASSKQVRTTTDIGTHPVSLAYIIAKQAQAFFQRLSDKKILLIGAGETISLIAAHLNGLQVSQLYVANRTLERSQALANTLGAQAICMSEIGQYLNTVDMVISATASQLPLLGKGALETAFKTRKHKPILLFDLAVPRDIEPEVAQLPDAYLYNMDDLQALIEQNQRTRVSAAKEADELTRVHALHYMQQLRVNSASHLISHYRHQVSEWTDIALLRAKKSLSTGHDPEQVLQNFADSLIKKMMHKPTKAIREAAEKGDIDKLTYLEQLIQ